MVYYRVSEHVHFKVSMKSSLEAEIYFVFTNVSCSLPSSSVRIDSREGFLRGGEWPVLTVSSAGHALHVFINGQLSGKLTS